MLFYPKYGMNGVCAAAMVAWPRSTPPTNQARAEGARASEGTRIRIIGTSEITTESGPPPRALQNKRLRRGWLRSYFDVDAPAKAEPRHIRKSGLPLGRNPAGESRHCPHPLQA